MGTDQKYLIYIRGDTLQEITEESAHLLYFFLNRLLQEQRRRVEEMAVEPWLRDRHFEDFAIQLLALLQQYRNVCAEYLVRSSAEE